MSNQDSLSHLLNPGETFEITFIKEGEESSLIRIQATAGEFLNQVAHRAGIVIQQTCGGVPSCTDCKVVVKEGVEGGFEPAAGPELRLMGNVYFITHERLSCQAKVVGASTVFVPTPRRPIEKNAARIALINRRREIERRERQTGVNESTGEKNHDEKESQKKTSKESNQKAGKKSGR
jgi:ferredoxin